MRTRRNADLDGMQYCMVPFVVGRESQNQFLDCLRPGTKRKVQSHALDYIATFVREQMPNICVIVSLKTCGGTGRFIYSDHSNSPVLRNYEEVSRDLERIRIGNNPCSSFKRYSVFIWGPS